MNIIVNVLTSEEEIDNVIESVTELFSDVILPENNDGSDGEITLSVTFE